MDGMGLQSVGFDYIDIILIIATDPGCSPRTVSYQT